MLPGRPQLSITDMPLDILDAEELFHVSLSAMQHGRDGEALEALKRLLALEPTHVSAQHLLGAQYAQLGMFARAESTWAALLAAEPNYSAARLQLGKLLMLKQDAAAASQVLAPLVGRTDDLGWYANAVVAASKSDQALVEQSLEKGLLCEQSNPGLADDMSQWLKRVRELSGQTGTPAPSAAPPAPEAASMLLSRYGKH